MAALHFSSHVVPTTPSPISRSDRNRTKPKPTLLKDPSFTTLSTSKTLTDLKQLNSQITKNPTFEILEYAQNTLQLFIKEHGVIKMDIYSSLFNSLIRGYSSLEFYDQAIFAFYQMVNLCVLPDNYTFPFVLSAFSKTEARLEGIQVHGLIVKSGFGKDVFVENSLIHFYGKCGAIEITRNVFDKMSERNVVSWTSLIDAYVKMDCYKEAVSLFLEMVETGVKPNSVTMVCVISACGKLQDLNLGKKVCSHVNEYGLEVNTLMANALVDMYMKCGDIETAKKLFDSFATKNLVLYNTMMSNYIRNRMEMEALDVLDEMIENGLWPDRVTMLLTVSACSQLGDISRGRWCHGYILRNGLEGWDNISNAMIDMYMKCGKQEIACRIFYQMLNKTLVSFNSLVSGLVRNGCMESALDIFNEMPERDLVSWNTMIGGLVKQSMFEEALDLFQSMQDDRVKADRVTMVSVASACGYLGALDLAKWIYTYILKNEMHIDMQLATALVDMFARCGDPQSAMAVFSQMDRRDVSAWTAAIGAMAMEGNGKRALELFNQMLSEGVKPDGVVFVGLLTALSHSGFVEEGHHYFNLMLDRYGITPQVVHYGCMVDLLGRAGLLQEALDLIHNMPMEPNDIIWSSLLAACRIHKRFDIATSIAERISNLDPIKTGVHVLLSNIYASAGKWSDVAKVRVHLKEKGVNKVPGSSSVDIDGGVYEFTCGESNPETIYVDAMLDEMNSRLKDAGYIPDLTNALLDVDDKEKEYLLNRHSEKQAIAFSLINTSPGRPIRVVKNLRICSDCHTFAKLVSKVYKREIIVRDNNRFHFFQCGMCSCTDYW